MKEFEQFVAKGKRPALAIGRATLITLLLFLAMGAIQLGLDYEEPEPLPLVEQFYFEPPPLSPPEPPPDEEFEFDMDFALSVDPAPFELSLDFLPVRVGIEAEEFVEMTFDLEKAIADYRTDGMKTLRIYERSEVDEPPRAMRTSEPQMPQHLKVVRVEAVVQYRVTVEGNVADVVILDCNEPDAAEPIARALERWRFRPAQIGGKAVPCWAQHQFNINPERKSDSPFQR